MPVFVTPRTWVAGEIPTAEVFNVHVRDNLLALKDPPHVVAHRYGADYITTSPTYVDVDATNLNFSLATHGGRLAVYVEIHSFHGSGDGGAFDVHLDGVSMMMTGEQGYGVLGSITQSWLRFTNAVAAGTHTVKLRYRRIGTTQTKMTNVHMWVREIS
jgi:hypothetical protein